MSATRDPSIPGTFAVLGGTGNTARRVVDRLRARGLEVRVGPRAGSPPFHWERFAGATEGLRR